MAKLTFEKAMKQLEEIVKELETDTSSLERSIELFEEGMRLSRFCAQKLDETEKRVTVLINTGNGQVEEKPFDPQQPTSPT
jgi:exodeoxyribonuclease VII small subunit